MVLLRLYTLTLLSLLPCLGELSLAPIFSDHMILQREVDIPLRGTASGAETITVTFQGEDYTSPVTEGKWRVMLPPSEAGGSHTLTVSAGAETLVLENVTFGDVWLCAGQSNMDSAIETYKKNRPDLYEGHPVKKHDKFRIFRAEKVHVDEPQEDIVREKRFDQGWYEITPKTRTRLFSATGYFFGYYLTQHVDVPIGLIQSCMGGTPIYAWMPEDAIAGKPEFAHVYENFKEEVKVWNESGKAEFEATVKEWERKTAAGEKAGWKPVAQKGPESKNRPHALHNGMISPLYDLPIKGVLWYQGEGAVMSPERSVQYEFLLQQLITSWREKWKNPEMPVLVVQLPGFGPTSKKPKEANRCLVRQSQKRAETLPNVMTVCTIDSGEQKDNHPPYKENVGKRLAHAARTLVYDQADAPRSPEYESHVTEGETTTITFKYCGEGLTLEKPLLEAPESGKKEVLGFILQNGADAPYTRIKAELISENQVKLTHPGITAPTSIRYAWEGFPNVNLYGSGKMPVFPFRLDELN